MSKYIYIWQGKTDKINAWPTKAAAVAAFLMFHGRKPIGREVYRVRIYRS